jgi:plastocyanin
VRARVWWLGGAVRRAGLLALAAEGCLAGCFSDHAEPTGPGAGDATGVEIRNFAFSPSDLTVRAGETVVWTNRDEALHTVTAADGTFDSSAFARDETFRFAPARPGAHPYTCRIHPFMQGTLRVE